MATVHNLFAHQVYEVEFENYSSVQQDLILEVSSFFGEDFTSDYTAHEHPIKNGGLKNIYNERISSEITQCNLKKVFDFISFHGKQYWETLGYSELLDPRILDMWVNAIRQGGFVASHNHNPILISGVFYIKADEFQGNLQLEDPNEYIIGRAPYRANHGFVPKRYTHEIDSRSGKLVLFPGWMKHHTKENMTDNIRISMAINFGCQGQVWFTDLG